jgi:hypothetical protein
MVKYHFPEPNDRDPITRSPEPIPVTFGWPISGTFQPRLDGHAIAWQGDKDTGVTLVRLDTGKEAWVETAGVRRAEPARDAVEDSDFPGTP